MKELNKKKVYGVVFGVSAAVTAVAGMLTSLVNYPTEAHREVARQLDSLNTQAFTDFAILESSEFLELSRTAEASYTQLAMIVTTIVGFVLVIALVWWAYRYLRNHRITKNPAWTTAWIVTVASVLGSLPTILYDAFVVFESVGTFSFTLTMVALAFAAPVALLINYIVARIVHWAYGRRRGFSVE